MTDDWCWFAFVVGLFAIAIIGIIVAISYNMNANEKILEMIKAGVNPLSASCAVDPRISVCMAAGMIEGNKQEYHGKQNSNKN